MNGHAAAEERLAVSPAPTFAGGTIRSLEDCMEALIDYRGKTPQKTSAGIPLITAKVVKGGRIETPDEFIAVDDYGPWMRRGIPKPGDVVITTEAPLGEVAQLGPERVALAQRLIALRGKSGVLDNGFLKFLMQSDDIQEQLRSRASGTTVLGIKQSELRKVLLTLPPIDEQRAIAHILGTLDDKIELNRRMREALANVLVHADYSDRASVLVVKRPDMFGFRNPGLMRIPVEVALKGGEPDCRNRTLHKMFRFVGVGEQAGTGIPKILHGWQSQHWSPPKLYDTAEPYNQTLIELRMTDLFPAPVMAGLKARFGGRFDGLSHVERVALALAASEGTVNHARLKGVSTEHPVDLSRVLQHLTQAGMLESTRGRGAVYHLPGEAIPTPEDIFGTAPSISAPSSSNLTGSSSNLNGSAPNLADRRDTDGCLLSDQLSLPIIDDLGRLSAPTRQRLQELAAEARSKRKISREKMVGVVLALCAEHFITLRCLAELVKRKPATLRNQYLTGLVQERKLSLAFPKTPTHERQAYCTSSALSE